MAKTRADKGEGPAITEPQRKPKRKLLKGSSSASKRSKKVAEGTPSRVLRPGPKKGALTWSPPSQWEPSELVLDPARHISNRVRKGEDSWSIRSFGNRADMTNLIEKVRKSPNGGKILDECGFNHFFTAFGSFCKSRVSRKVLKALIERFWNTKNTFHLPVGEMFITPTDIGVILGLPCGGDPISFTTIINKERMYELIGPIANTFSESGGLVEGPTLLRGFDELKFFAIATPLQRVRLLLLYIFGRALFPQKAAKIPLSLLAPLSELNIIGTYDWAGAVWATLTTSLRAATRVMDESPEDRRRDVALYGMWPLLEVWLNEHVPALAFFTPFRIVNYDIFNSNDYCARSR